MHLRILYMTVVLKLFKYALIILFFLNAGQAKADINNDQDLMENFAELLKEEAVETEAEPELAVERCLKKGVKIALRHINKIEKKLIKDGRKIVKWHPYILSGCIAHYGVDE